ncbi:hypothetical protein ACFYRY_39945 [Streptomyces sp. NPDC005263]|uniref:hypothetical protein n=1 Tax=Streptomyces sp. NPDC005263 TaxID=3364711 RepID=UPI0036B93E78
MTLVLTYVAMHVVPSDAVPELLRTALRPLKTACPLHARTAIGCGHHCPSATREQSAPG